MADDRALGDVNDLDVYFLNEHESARLKDNFKVGYPLSLSIMFMNHTINTVFQVLIGKILVEYCPELSWMKKCVPDHIDHQYSEEMSRKSEIFPLKVIQCMFESCLRIKMRI